MHKEVLDCNGVRDRTKYKRKQDMTEADMRQDLRLLEECNTFVQSCQMDKKDRRKRIRARLPDYKARLRAAARQRGIKYDFIIPVFSRHKQNTTAYKAGEKAIYWLIEWHFMFDEEHKVIKQDGVHENSSMKELMAALYEKGHFGKMADDLQSVEHSFTILLKAEGKNMDKERYYPLDFGKTLAENLSGRSIVEYPLIYVVLGDSNDRFNVVKTGELAAEWIEYISVVIAQNGL